MSARVRLAVTYNDHTIMYYPVPADRSWRVDAPSRCLVIGVGGMPRTYVPLDQVRSFDVEPAEIRASDACTCPGHAQREGLGPIALSADCPRHGGDLAGMWTREPAP